jgi:hypothetical protein
LWNPILKFGESQPQLPFVDLLEKNVKGLSYHRGLIHMGSMDFSFEPFLLVWANKHINGTIVPFGLWPFVRCHGI